MALSLDRQAFINIITEGQGDIGRAMQPPPEGLWGMPPEMLKTLPGYDPDVQKNRAEARRLMGKLGYGPANRLNIKLSVRDLPFLRDPVVILIDQLKEVYIDGELETIDTTILRYSFLCRVRIFSGVTRLQAAAGQAVKAVVKPFSTLSWLEWRSVSPASALSLWRHGPHARVGIHKAERRSKSQRARQYGSVQARQSKMPSMSRSGRPARSPRCQRNPRCGSNRAAVPAHAAGSTKRHHEA
jgi:ABC-type transport system substrate-binding protein